MEISVTFLDLDENKLFSREIYNLEASGTDYLHVDVMDGKFVKKNNLDLAYERYNMLKNITMLPVEVHLMTKDLEKHIVNWASLAPYSIIFHPENLSEREIIEYIKLIKSYGVKPRSSCKT